MALIVDARGREENLAGIAEVERLVGAPFGIIAALVNRELFPEPVHMAPPLWKLRDVERWRKRAIVEKKF